MTPINLSYLLLCKNVSQGKTRSFHDVVDMLSLRSAYQGDRFKYQVKIYLALGIYADDESKSYDLDVVAEAPDGAELLIGTVTMGYKEGVFQRSLAQKIEFPAHGEGIYWIKILYQDHTLGKYRVAIRLVREELDLK